MKADKYNNKYLSTATSLNCPLSNFQIIQVCTLLRHNSIMSYVNCIIFALGVA